MPDLKDLARSLRAFGPELSRRVAEAERETAKEARDIAIRQYSSGPYSLENLADAGHPYGYRNSWSDHALGQRRQRGSSVSYPPSVINAGGTYDDGKPRGTFSRSWSDIAQTSVSGGFVTSFRNTDPNTEFLFGTDLMVDRSGMLTLIPEAVETSRERRISKAIDNAYRDTF